MFCFVEISKRYLKCYKKIDKYFFETETYKKAEKMFQADGIIIFTGPPGCGKTMAAIHLLEKENCDNWTFRKISAWEELSFIENDKNSLVLIDNIFFRRPIDLQLERWWEELDKIYDKFFASSENELGSNNLRIVITARPNVIDRACDFMGKVTPILNKGFIVDTNKLTKTEKGKILAMQVIFAKEEKGIPDPNINEEFKDKVVNSEGPIGFPLCAHLYVCGEEYKKSGTEFFTRPIEYLLNQIKDELKGDQTNKTKSLLFCLFFHEWHTKMGNTDSFDIQNENVCEQCLQKVSPNIIANFGPFEFRELESEAQRLSGVLFKEVGEHAYKFVHDSVYEAVAAYLCQTYVSETAKYFPIDIIQHQSYENVSEREMSTLATRLLYGTLDRQLSDVFSCRIFRNRKFVDCFCEELLKKDRETISEMFTVPNHSSAAMLPCMFWTSCNNLTYLTERLYDIVKKQDINTEYQLYVTLYGKCCERNKGLLKTINGVLCDNSELIKNHVIEFEDCENNSILHILMESNFSDEFVAESVKTIFGAKMRIKLKNSDNVTPLMMAVEQLLPRIEVIKSFMDVSPKPKLHNQDKTGSTVFHHCVGSNNDDKTCLRYLDVILRDGESNEFLSKNDLYGDTALSIAAKCQIQSRIRSICKLLENTSALKIINIVNDEGHSPLHLSVKFLKDTKVNVELECCVRVTIFILYGARPNIKSDGEKTAVQECHYELVKNIIQNSEDKKYMEDALKAILEKLQCKQCKDMPEQKLNELTESIPSVKISVGIRRCISRAVYHFEHNLFLTR